MKRGRLKSVGRWGVWVFTALVLISIPVSVWVKPGLFIQYERPDAARVLESWSLHLIDGRVVWLSDKPQTSAGWIARNPRFGAQLVEADPGWRVWVGVEVDRVGFHRFSGSWLKPTVERHQVFGSWIGVPLICPAVLLLVWSGVLIWNPTMRRRLKKGCCEACDYSLAGLDGGVCPECGEGAEDMEESKTTPPCHPEQG
jgi:hypothetical protein